MIVKLKTRLPEIENYFMEKYGAKENFENLNNYKFIYLLCEIVPDLKISKGLPNSLLGDVWEIAYDVVGNFDVANVNLMDQLINFFEYIATSTHQQLFCYITYFLDEFKSINANHVIFNKLKPHTKNLWVKYLKSCK